MKNKLELLQAEALKLPAIERVALTQILLASLEENIEIDEAWAVAIERRIAAIENGEVQAVPIAEALAQVRAGLANRK